MHMPFSGVCACHCLLCVVRLTALCAPFKVPYCSVVYKLCAQPLQGVRNVIIAGVIIFVFF